MNVKKVLFATDFSTSSDAALSYAVSLAAEADALLQIVHVGNEAAAYLSAYGGFSGVPDLAEQVARENRTLLTQVKPMNERVRYEHHYLSGSPEHEILAFADREHVDLIVMGSHGRTGLSRLLLGSVAEHVVRRSNCPVLTVKYPIQEGEESAESEEQQAPPAPISKHSLH